MAKANFTTQTNSTPLRETADKMRGHLITVRHLLERLLEHRARGTISPQREQEVLEFATLMLGDAPHS